MTSAASLHDALERLPHRPPFRFVSELEALEPGVRAEGAWLVSGKEDFFAGHFPGDPLVPGVLLAEALAQLAGIVAWSGSERAGRPARLARVDVKVLAAVRPPARVQLAAKVVRATGGLVLFDVAATVGGSPAASGSIVLAEGPAAGGSQ